MSADLFVRLDEATRRLLLAAAGTGNTRAVRRVASFVEGLRTLAEPSGQGLPEQARRVLIEAEMGIADRFLRSFYGPGGLRRALEDPNGLVVAALDACWAVVGVFEVQHLPPIYFCAGARCDGHFWPATEAMPHPNSCLADKGTWPGHAAMPMDGGRAG